MNLKRTPEASHPARSVTPDTPRKPPKLTPEAVADKLRAKGYVLVGEFQGTHRSTLRVRCLQAGHDYEAQASFLLSSTRPARCPGCWFQEQRGAIVRNAQTNNLELLEDLVPGPRGGVSRQKRLVRCLTCGHEWRTQEFSGCPKCVRDDRSLPTEDVRARLAGKRLQVLDVQQRDRRAETRFRVRVSCLECGHEFNLFDLSPDGCPRCLRKERGSIPEREVVEIIERLTGWKFPKARPDWLRGYNSHPMELDGYNEEHQVALEFQGPQHYEPIYGEDNLATNKRNDDRKRKLCQRHGVLLIRVPYWKKDPESFIRAKLVAAGVLSGPSPPTKTPTIRVKPTPKGLV